VVGSSAVICTVSVARYVNIGASTLIVFVFTGTKVQFKYDGIARGMLYGGAVLSFVD